MSGFNFDSVKMDSLYECKKECRKDQGIIYTFSCSNKDYIIYFGIWKGEISSVNMLSIKVFS